MTTYEFDRLQRAKQEDCDEIIALINQALPKEITAKVSLKDSCLKVMLEAAEAPAQASLVELVRQAITDLNAKPIRLVKVYGRELGDDFPHWQEEFEVPYPIDLSNAEPELQSSESLQADEPDPSVNAQERNLWGSVFGTVIGAAGAVGEAATYASGAIAGAVTGAAGAVGETAVSASGAVAGTVAGAAEAVGGAAVNAGNTVVGTVTGAAGAVGGAATHAGEAVAGAVTGAIGAVGNTAVQARETITGTAIGVAGAVGNTAMQTTDGIGHVLDMITNSPQLQELTKALKVDWLLAIVDKVDIVQAEAHVKKLQQKYPHEKPSEIAHRIITEKAFYVGASGFASSLMPGLAAAMFAVDLAATMALQAEMMYQIAGAYGLNLQESARKGEVLAIFGMALGGNTALKAGLGFARNIPAAGAVIGASSNAVMLYSLGFAACRFYEAKLNPAPSQATCSTTKATSDQYLESLLGQQMIMDQILLHLVLAGSPGKTLQQILPELQALNLNSASLISITAHSQANPQSLPPLENLLDRLNQEFAVSLLAQCEKVAQADGVITPQETRVINTIKKKFRTVLISR
ncbi:MAG TPA: hypothetical protein V6C78_07250 [Crinalium sp.]